MSQRLKRTTAGILAGVILTGLVLVLVLNTAAAQPGGAASAAPAVSANSSQAVSANAAVAQSAAVAAGDWPQLQHDPQRSGYTSDTVAPPYKLAWTRNFQPERVSRDVQAIVCSGRLFVSTEAGNLYALNAATGQDLWHFSVGSPILHTAACDSGKVVVAAVDGSITAVDAVAGTQVWKFQALGHTGFTNAPLIVDSTVFMGERAGIFYAIDLSTGQAKWQFDAGAPVLNTAAYNNGRIYFCDEALYVHALNSSTGAEVWKSAQLYGQSCKQYHPVVAGGYVVLRPMMSHRPSYSILEGWSPFNRTWDSATFASRKTQYSGFLNGAGAMPQDLIDGQAGVVQYYNDNPYEQSLFVLNESDGKQAFVPPQFALMALPGPLAPVVSDGKGGLMMPWIFIDNGWARLDLSLKRVSDIVLPPGGYPGVNPDETVNLSFGGNRMFIFHTEEANLQWTGVFDWDTRQFYPIASSSVDKRWWQMTDNLENGNNSASIANGYFYHIVFHQLAAWTSQ